MCMYIEIDRERVSEGKEESNIRRERDREREEKLPAYAKLYVYLLLTPPSPHPDPCMYAHRVRSQDSRISTRSPRL
jgi:hypothetical protein